MSNQIQAEKKEYKKLNQKKFRKRYLFYGVALVCLIILIVVFNMMNTENNHLNTWLVHQHTQTVRIARAQHKKFLNDQAQLDTIANYHDMFNNYYLEMHPHIKNYHQLLKSNSYMKMSKDTTHLNNHFNNQMVALKNKELVEQKQIPHEHRSSIFGNINNELNQHTFNHRQDQIKNNVIIVFMVGLIGFIALMRGLAFKSHVLHVEHQQLQDEVNSMQIAKMKEDQKKQIKEFGDDEPE